MDDVATMVADLIAAGTPPEVAARVVTQAFVAGAMSANVRESRVDTMAEKRRAYDRERKRLQRGSRPPDREWTILVAEIAERDGGKCTYCGSMENLTADHVVPLTRGGGNDPSNLTACCIPCNTKKGNKLVSEWVSASSTRFHPNVRPIPPDSKNTPLSKKEILESKKEKRESTRGNRLPDNWQPATAEWGMAVELIGTPRARAELEKFRDYWKQQPGAKGVKLDWAAAWRNWIRRAAEFRGHANGKTAGTSSVIDAWDRLIDKTTELDSDPGQEAFHLVSPRSVPRS